MPTILPPPAVRHGQVLDYEGLLREAREAVAEAAERGVKRYEIAEALEVTPPAITFALKQSGGRVASLQRKIIEHLSNYRVREDVSVVFRVERKPEGRSEP